MAKKKDSKDTSKINEKLKILQSKVQEDSSIDDSLKNEIGEISELIDKKREEDKGFLKITFVLVLLLLISFLVVIYDDIFPETQYITTYKYYNHVDSLGNEIEMDSKEFISFLFTKIDTLQTTLINTNKEKISLLEENYRSKMYLDIVENAYGIKFNYIENENSTTYRIDAPKIDSALMIYEYYKDKLYYDEENKQWMITLPNK